MGGLLRVSKQLVVIFYQNRRKKFNFNFFFVLLHFAGNLEVFYSSLLKFSPKRLHFFNPAMKGRIMVAVLDYNANVSRERATTAKGIKFGTVKKFY